MQEALQGSAEKPLAVGRWVIDPVHSQVGFTVIDPDDPKVIAGRFTDFPKCWRRAPRRRSRSSAGRCHRPGCCPVSWVYVVFDRGDDESLVAGATGAIGERLLPRLVAAGHGGHGMTRSDSRQAMPSELGAVRVVADALDPDQVAEAVARAKPDVIVHQLAAIGASNPRHFDRDFAATNRLRTEGTDHLLSAAQALGVRRFMVDSGGAFAYARSGGAVKRLPRFIGRLFVGEVGAVMMTELRAASDARAKRELGWLTRHASWRQGFAAA
jgi:hypothetical protein